MHCKVDETLPDTPIWIDSDQQLAEHVAKWQGCIALDTEFIRTDTFFPVAGLYQVAWRDNVYLIDPLQISDWTSFKAVLEGDDVCKIMHACQEDMELIFHHLGVTMKNVFDTQLANAFVSENYSLSYAALVEELLGVVLSKHATRSNWLQRPLTEEQVTYAVEDVVYLEEMYRALLEKLGPRERWFQREMAQRSVYTPGDSQLYYRNLKKAWQLNAIQLSALRSLCQWREDTAKRLDVPRNRVVWDDHLYQFARVQRLEVHQVRRALPKGVANRFADDLVAAHAAGLQQAPPPRLPGPLSPGQNAVVKRLREAGKKQAQIIGLAPELLSRKREVEECVRHFVREGVMSALFLDWREEVVGEHFHRIFASEPKLVHLKSD